MVSLQGYVDQETMDGWLSHDFTGGGPGWYISYNSTDSAVYGACAVVLTVPENIPEMLELEVFADFFNYSIIPHIHTINDAKSAVASVVPFEHKYYHGSGLNWAVFSNILPLSNVSNERFIIFGVLLLNQAFVGLPDSWLSRLGSRAFFIRQSWNTTVQSYSLALSSPHLLQALVAIAALPADPWGFLTSTELTSKKLAPTLRNITLPEYLNDFQFLGLDMTIESGNDRVIGPLKTNQNLWPKLFGLKQLGTLVPLRKTPATMEFWGPQGRNYSFTATAKAVKILLANPWLRVDAIPQKGAVYLVRFQPVHAYSPAGWVKAAEAGVISAPLLQRLQNPSSCCQANLTQQLVEEAVIWHLERAVGKSLIDGLVDLSGLAFLLPLDPNLVGFHVAPEVFQFVVRRYFANYGPKEIGETLWTFGSLVR